MRAKATTLIVICLLFLVGSVGAILPDTVAITGNSSWLVAGSGSTATYSVIVTNMSSGVLDADISFSGNDTFGTLKPLTNKTDPNGIASSIFTVGTKSGTAPIRVRVQYHNITEGNYDKTFDIPQNIDHASAYYADFTHPLSGTVASQVPFSVSLTDQYRNPVDNRRGNHIIKLHVSGPSPDDCGFAESGFAHTISPTLDANGNTSVTVKLTQSIGDNNILMEGYGSIPNQLEWITAEARGEPFLITQVVSPSGSPPTLPADNTSVFTIIFTLYDIYGNPTNNQTVWVNTSVKGEEKQMVSNSLGQVMYPYGPRSSIGEIYITAYSVANSTVTSTPLMVKFKDTGAEIISLTANPNVMPSHDVPSSTPVSNIIATVADASGNAVAGETVTFTLGTDTYDGAYNHTLNSSLSSSSAITDAYGQAVVQFTPGSFTTIGNPGFNASATGHCNVNATWNSTQKNVLVTWKNYPFLSVSTSVEPDTVEINQTVNVSIVFKGDGWAFTQPSDIVLVTDLSGSMLNNNKLTDAKTALKKFVGLSGGKLSIALASYSNAPVSYSTEAVQLYNIQQANVSAYPFNPYDTVWTRMYGQPGNPDWFSDAKIDRNFTTISTDLNTTISSYGAKGGTCIGCGLGAAMSEFNTNGDPTHPRVIIIMSDGIANLAPINSTFPLKAYLPSDYKSSTDTSITAKDAAISIASTLKGQNIKIFTIAFGSDADSTTLAAIASTGCSYVATDGNALSAVYGDIYAKVSDPGVDTSMSTDFTYINVTGITYTGDQVYTYVPSTKIGWQNGTISSKDQTSDWGDHKLDFTIGTIKLKEQWNATFQLRVNKSGLIDIFGKDSTVTFNGGTQTLYLPQTFITVVPKLDVLNITAKTITLTNLKVTETEIKVLLPVRWNTTYTGNQTLTEKVYYRIDSGPWVLFDTKTHAYDPLTMNYVDFAQLDVTKLPPGGYLIKVVATASDAPDATIILDNPVNVGNRGRTYIKLQ